METTDTDVTLWEAAKLDAAIHVAKKKNKKPFLQRLMKRSKSNDSLHCTEKEQVEIYVDMIKKCPLISSPQSMRHNAGRKIGRCEKTETDRTLVSQSMKYYLRSAYIDDNMMPIDDTSKMSISK